MFFSVILFSSLFFLWGRAGGGGSGAVFEILRCNHLRVPPQPLEKRNTHFQKLDTHFQKLVINSKARGQQSVTLIIIIIITIIIITIIKHSETQMGFLCFFGEAGGDSHEHLVYFATHTLEKKEKQGGCNIEPKCPPYGGHHPSPAACRVAWRRPARPCAPRGPCSPRWSPFKGRFCGGNYPFWVGFKEKPIGNLVLVGKDRKTRRGNYPPSH